MSIRLFKRFKSATLPVINPVLPPMSLIPHAEIPALQQPLVVAHISLTENSRVAYFHVPVLEMPLLVADPRLIPEPVRDVLDVLEETNAILFEDLKP